ncbi:hypothetical protein GQ457_15G016790 [Hibiscus cannabinus]
MQEQHRDRLAVLFHFFGVLFRDNTLKPMKIPEDSLTSTRRISTGSRWISSILSYVILLAVVSQPTIGSRCLATGALSPKWVRYGFGQGLGSDDEGMVMEMVSAGMRDTISFRLEIRLSRVLDVVNGGTAQNGEDQEIPIEPEEVDPKKTTTPQTGLARSDILEDTRPPPPFPQRLKKKMRIEEFETVDATKACLEMMHKKAPAKRTDLGSFTIACFIGNHYSGKALCDPGASINLMPKYVFKKLGIGEAKPTTLMLQLAERSYVQPEGKIEDILIRVDKFIFPADFLVLDCEADENAPIIRGRPFLATGRVMIDFEKGELALRVDEQQVKIKVFTVPGQHGMAEESKNLNEIVKTRCHTKVVGNTSRADIPIVEYKTDWRIPIDTEVAKGLTHEQCKAISTRSGNILNSHNKLGDKTAASSSAVPDKLVEADTPASAKEDHNIPSESEETEITTAAHQPIQSKKDTTEEPRPPPPFPQRLRK